MTVLCPVSLRVGTNMCLTLRCCASALNPLHTPLVPRLVNCARSEPVSRVLGVPIFCKGIGMEQAHEGLTWDQWGSGMSGLLL